MQVPQHGSGAQVVGDETTRHVVVELNVRGDLGECFRILVVILVEEVGNGKHNLQDESEGTTMRRSFQELMRLSHKN